MSIQAKILDVYQLFLLSDRNILKTLRFTKITRPTLIKYIKIIECLDFSLLEYLDKKGKEKLKINDAIYLCDNVMNPDQQYKVFHTFHTAQKKDKIRCLNESMTCAICMDTNAYFEYTPCCKTPICETCFSKTFETYIQDTIFKSVKCPYCNTNLDLTYVKWYLKNRIQNDTELWRKTKTFPKKCHFNLSYQINLYNKYLTMISRIETFQNYYINDIEPDFKTLLGEEKYFGACSECLPLFEKDDLAVIPKRRWNNFDIADIPRECGNGEGGILVVEPRMFRCIVCKSKDEDYDDGEFKKCPHCGIKTVKPSGCNFIYCGDHRWCWICNERIENNENGHNKHYWTGPGTSPYTNQCRTSINSNALSYVIEGKCDCSACKEHGGAPICKNIDCMKRTFVKYISDGNDMFNAYCVECQKER